nr:glutathione peroxidase-like [Penaeus vannamei]
MELENGIKHVRPGNGFLPDFILLKKTDVNGVDEHPLFTYLKEYCPPTRKEFADPSQLFYHPMKSNDIRWNWEKFLITKSGKPYMRYDADTRPDKIKSDVAFLLQQEF